MSIEFDGTGDYINCGSDSGIDDAFATPGGTVMFWMYADAWNKQVMSKNQWHIYIDNPFLTSYFLNFYHTFQYGGDSQWRKVGLITLSAWYHIAITYNNASAANNPTFYVNGVSVAPDNYLRMSGNPVSDAASNFMIGSDSGGYSNFDGKLHDVRLYKGKMLSTAEIQAIYYTYGRSPMYNNCAGRWQLDEGYPGQSVSGSAGMIKNQMSALSNGTAYGNPTYAIGDSRRRSA